MILNEYYFNDLEITDDDIIDDVEELDHELTLEEFHKLPDQYNHDIEFRIKVNDDNDRTFIQTSLLPRLFKRLDTIFELYGIEHSLYVLTSFNTVKHYETIVKFGNYQIFCGTKYKENEFLNNTYDYFFIYVFVNYPKFNYKRAFRFLYTVINLYMNCKQIDQMAFEPIATNDYVTKLTFLNAWNHIDFHFYNKKLYVNRLYLDMELTEEDKRVFYDYVFRHFFGEKVKKIDYGAIDRDVPLELLRLR